MNTFEQMLSNWEDKAHEISDRAEYTLSLRQSDLVKIKALAEAYELPEALITEGLLNAAIKEAEQAIPYVKGSKVIRVEEGENVYADAGRTPAYVEAEIRLSKILPKQDK
ncbi:hypothetical protein [Pseudomonas putida]|uniref:hypothetical protein n=1 Tax=Pseudomonas putida TaxID=303 RepID=UPI0008195C15|nr:hypothetical protein [Pseudomonas putida]OCT24034.1 hypothetical protein A6E23_14000 [Pseudomonas putida]OCT27113.1 hypothetical protein A6E20_06960 [Pseudomonas putida]OCT28397.1 hypothetical protein A6E24_06775 [Pseudomonas putida]OCT38369.1 hypothetical protein A6E19_14520 [Pseudomonas putida]